MRIHIIGVSTEFMTGIAVLARQIGHDVTASDHCFDGVTRHKLDEIGVQLHDGFNKDNLAYKPDLVVISNDVDSDNQEIAATHRLAIPYLSGSEWLEKYVLDEEIIKKVTTNAASSHKSRNPHIPDTPPTKHAPKIHSETHFKTKRIIK